MSKCIAENCPANAEDHQSLCTLHLKHEGPWSNYKMDVDNGLYRIWWREGGSSLAAVGRDGHGRCWLAPTNWISVPTFDWSKVMSYDPIGTATDSFGRPIGDFPDDVPTQDEFHEAHKDAKEYGEEGEYLLVSKQVEAAAALKMIQDIMNEWGINEDYIPKTTSDLQTYDVGWGYDRDSYHYSEGSFWICSDSNNVSKRYEAWGVETGV